MFTKANVLALKKNPLQNKNQSMHVLQLFESHLGIVHSLLTVGNTYELFTILNVVSSDVTCKLVVKKLQWTLAPTLTKAAVRRVLVAGRRVYL